MHHLVPNFDNATDEINRKITNTEDRPFAMRLQLVAQGHSHPRKEFIHGERFRHIIVGAKIKGLYLACLITAARKRNHGNGLVTASDHWEQIIPFYIWKAEIKNDDVGG